MNPRPGIYIPMWPNNGMDDTHQPVRHDHNTWSRVFFFTISSQGPLAPWAAPLCLQRESGFSVKCPLIKPLLLEMLGE